MVATSLRRIDVSTTLFRLYVPVGCKDSGEHDRGLGKAVMMEISSVLHILCPRYGDPLKPIPPATYVPRAMGKDLTHITPERNRRIITDLQVMLEGKARYINSRRQSQSELIYISPTTR